jgi:hypothetical protein
MPDGQARGWIGGALHESTMLRGFYQSFGLHHIERKLMWVVSVRGRLKGSLTISCVATIYTSDLPYIGELSMTDPPP